MNPLLTTGLLTGNKLLENSDLEGVSQGGDRLLAGSEFQAGFAELWQQLAASGGKEQPLDVAALRELKPELIEKLSDQLDISQEALLSLPPMAIETLARVIENNHASSQGPGILSALNAQRLLQNELSKGVKPEINQADGDVAEQAAKQNELISNNLFRAVNQDNVQKPGIDVKEMLDTEVLQQASTLKLMNNDLEQKLFAGPLTPELHNNKLVEQLAALDKVNMNSVNPVHNHVMTNSLRPEQQIAQLPRIEVPVNQPQWGQSVGDRLMLMVNNKVQAANIILNPPELGPIEVRVNMNNDQASVHFVSGHAAVRDAIEEAFPRLREMFAQNGISLADANVSQHSAQQERRFDNTSGSSFNTGDQGQNDMTDATESEITQHIINNGLVDHYV